MKRQLHLNLFIHSRGHHEASWRHPASSALRQILVIADVGQGQRRGSPMAPRRLVMTAAVDEQIEVQLPFHRVGPCWCLPPGPRWEGGRRIGNVCPGGQLGQDACTTRLDSHRHSATSGHQPPRSARRTIAPICGFLGYIWGDAWIRGVIADVSPGDRLPFLVLALAGERRHVSSASP